MSEILLFYKRPDPTTWVYMSSFLTVGLYFVFHRFWSIRNLDLLLLILLAPGLLIIHEGYLRQLDVNDSLVKRRGERPADDASLGWLGAMMQTAAMLQIDPPTGPEASANSSGKPEAPSRLRPTDIQRLGFIYLFVVEMLLLVRLMFDPMMVRRPRLDPNLTTGGLTFIGISLFIFMMANVVTSSPRTQVTQGPPLGPGYALMNMLPAIPTRPDSNLIGPLRVQYVEGQAVAGESVVDQSLPTTLTPRQTYLARVAKASAILAHLAIVSGIVLIGNRHFGNLNAGMGCALLYLILPYTAQMTGRVDHAVPAALLLWAVLLYRRPMLAGMFLGLAGGLVYYPLFLLPLWLSFYWQRGLRAFLTGFLVMIVVLMLTLSLDKSASLLEHFQRMFGLFNPVTDAASLSGFWSLGINPIWRLPVIVGFVIVSVLFAAWPAQKNFGTLMSGSAAVMVAAQFWHGYGGGLYLAWFLPLLLLVIFRPNVQDRTAMKMVLGSERRAAIAS